jgi:hypothetical protein
MESGNVTIESILANPELLNYSVVKRVFDRNHFKVMNPLVFACIEDDGVVALYDQSQFRKHYRNLFCIYSDMSCPEKEKLKQALFVDQWFKDCSIRRYTKIAFLPPPEICASSVYNTWSGFAIDKITTESTGNILPFQKHISILVNHNPAGVDYFTKWLAQIIQEPGEIIGIAVVLQSVKGVGKNVFLNAFSKMIGSQYYLETASPKKDLFSRFSDGRSNRLLIAVDTFANSDEFNSPITSEKWSYESRKENPINVRNFNRFIFTNNISTIDDNSRRYVVFKCSPEFVDNQAYFNEFVAYMDDSGNQKAIIEYLRSIDITSIQWMNDRPILR